jgi:hypothetical protein
VSVLGRLIVTVVSAEVVSGGDFRTLSLAAIRGVVVGESERSS